MIRQLISILLLSILSFFFFVSCSSIQSSAADSVETEEDNSFLARPRFEKPTSRPLGRVLLSWNAIEEADGYEIEMSSNEDFTPKDKTWTVQGLNLEVPVPEGRQVYFRIRSFNNAAFSRWSIIVLEDDKG